ncbi:MAG: hypothetical protein PGN25_03840 [Methylorubrum populi]
MPLRDLIRHARALLVAKTRSDAGTDAVVPAAVHDAARAALVEVQRKLAVAEHRLAVLEGSNRTAARALRRFLQERGRFAREREHLVAAREAAEVGLSAAVSDRQRTIVLNDRLLAELRGSEEARQRLEADNRHLHRRISGTDAADPLPAFEPDRPAGRGEP